MRPVDGPPLVLGHRGARHAATENTLAAFELSRLEGAVGTEFDVLQSADGDVFVLHDEDLTRISAGRDSRRLSSMSTREAAAVRLPGGERLPRLGEVLDWAAEHEQLLNIELKAYASGSSIGQAVARELNSRPGTETTTLVSSFHPTLLRDFRSTNTQVPTAFLFCARHLALATPSLLRACGASVLHPQASVYGPRWRERFGGHLQQWKEPPPVNVWTVNSPIDGAALGQLGVNALVSDNPGLLIRELTRS